MADATATVRLDRWLLAARLYKTRSFAQEACEGGHVSVNDRVAAASRPVKVGDRVDAFTAGGRRVVEVAGLGERRGSAEAARALYVDHTPPAPPTEEPFVLRERGLGRPTKRDRRVLDWFRGR